MSFPKRCVRGIPNDSFMNSTVPAAHLFYFKENPEREDEWKEQSINWQDDNKVNSFSLKQVNDKGDIQFKYGLAILPINEITSLNQKTTCRGSLSYERQPLENNPFHGNILLNKDIPKKIMVMIAATIALSVDEIVLANPE